MKKYKLLLFLVLSIPAMAQEKNELILKTDVSDATVFINGAQIIRRKTIELLPGKSTIKFAGLSPYIDSKSVQVKVNNEVMVLSVNHQLNYTDSLKQSNEISKLESQLETLNDKIKIENANLEIIKEEVAFLNDNKNIGGTNQGVNLLNLKNAADYYHEKISAFKFKEIEIKKLLDKLEKDKNAIEHQELILGRTKTLPVGEVLVKVDSKVAAKCNIELSYYVNNAGWYPSYDIRANTIEDPVELVYKATIHQNTKEDWKNVKLKVSSVNPNIGNIAPQLQTYFLNYYSKPPKYDGNNSTNQVTGKVMDNNTKEPIAGASILIKGTTIGTVSNLDGNFELSIPANGGQLEISYIGYEKQLLPISNSQMNIFMKENLMKLEEVAVVGYGTKNNIEEALQGKVAGISIRGYQVLI